MAIVPKQRSALWALAAAGGLWAWQNRDKLQGYLKQSGILDQISQATQGSTSTSSHRRPTTTIDAVPMTGETRRIGNDANNEFTTETQTKYDPSI